MLLLIIFDPNNKSLHFLHNTITRKSVTKGHSYFSLLGWEKLFLGPALPKLFLEQWLPKYMVHLTKSSGILKGGI